MTSRITAVDDGMLACMLDVLNDDLNHCYFYLNLLVRWIGTRLMESTLLPRPKTLRMSPRRCGMPVGHLTLITLKLTFLRHLFILFLAKKKERKKQSGGR